MPTYRYLIIGNGMAADAAVGGIRQVDPQGPIGVIGAETHAAYNRPPLSKGLWQGRSLESIWRRNSSDEAVLHLGRTATALDLNNKEVTDDRETVYRFEKLLLVTGGQPRRLAQSGEGLIYFRTLDDYHHLRLLAERQEAIVVLGGGLLGMELSGALSKLGKQVTLVTSQSELGADRFPPDLAQSITRRYREEGVKVLCGRRVISANRDGGIFQVRMVEQGPTTDIGEEELEAGVVVAALGITPNLELAQAAGLACQEGILVDSALRTAHPSVCAAGDAAAFLTPGGRRARRIEHEENANLSGALAGRALAGEAIRYEPVAYFYSDFLDLSYEAVGQIDSRLQVVARWQEPLRRGVLYYLCEGRIEGILFWNVRAAIQTAKGLIGHSAGAALDELPSVLME